MTTMTCGRARRLLWPDTGPREATGEIIAAREHVSGCALCRRFLEDMQRVSGRIRDAMPRPEAPVEVRDRLFKVVARARTDQVIRGATRRQRWWAAGAVATLLLGGAWLGYELRDGSGDSPEEALAALADDHVRSTRSSGFTSSDSLEVVGWLKDRLPFAVQVPIFPEAQLKGARLFLAGRRSGAVVDYAIAGRSLSYYVFPTGAGEAAGPPLDVQVASRAGYRIALWQDAGLTHALVAGLPGPKLVELARYCMHQMMALGEPRGSA